MIQIKEPATASRRPVPLLGGAAFSCWSPGCSQKVQQQQPTDGSGSVDGNPQSADLVGVYGMGRPGSDPGFHFPLDGLLAEPFGLCLVVLAAGKEEQEEQECGFHAALLSCMTPGQRLHSLRYWQLMQPMPG